MTSTSDTRRIIEARGPVYRWSDPQTHSNTFFDFSNPAVHTFAYFIRDNETRCKSLKRCRSHYKERDIAWFKSNLRQLRANAEFGVYSNRLTISEAQFLIDHIYEIFKDISIHLSRMQGRDDPPFSEFIQNFRH